MQTIPAREIKRRGIAAVDEALADGPVHVIKNDRIAYVVLNEEQYRELLEAQEEAYLVRVRRGQADFEAGRLRRTTAQEIIDEFDLEA